MTAPLRGAIIGFGKVAELGHAPGWQQADGFDIVAVADPSPERRAAARLLFPAAHTYQSQEALLAAEDLQFADIASPPAFHGPALAACARRGLHILCEKPVTTTARDYRDGRAAVIDAGVVLHPVHNWKHAEAYRLALEILGQQRLGVVREIRFSTERNGWAASDNDWRAHAAVAGGGILVDHGWHTFYLLLGLTAAANGDHRVRPDRICAQIENRRYLGADVEDTASCEISFGELRGKIDLTWAASARRTAWTLIGERGQLRIEDDRFELVVDGRSDSGRMSMSLSQGSHHPEWFPGVISSFAAELGQPPEERRARAEAEECLSLLEHAYRSARAGGGVIDLPQAHAWLAGMR